MDPQVSTSFIPKKSFDNGSQRGAGAAVGLVLLVAILIFVASCVAAGGVVLYEQLKTKSIETKSVMLEKNKNVFNPASIQEMARMDTRITEAKKLLAKHVAPSVLFSLLGKLTLERVQLSSFDYSLKADGTPLITFKGEGDSFSTIALQSHCLGQNKMLKDIEFSGVSATNASSKVSFGVAAAVVPSLTLYSNVAGGTTNPFDSASGTPSETCSKQTQ